MSESAIVQFGFDDAAVRSGLAEMESKIGQSASRAGKNLTITPRISGQSGKFQAGQVAMQLQDIAVQAQGGTSALTIFAQQGSQILSAFGPIGAIAGAVAAVGGAALTAGAASKSAFNEMIQGAAAASIEVEKLSRTGGLSELEAGVKKLAESSKQLDESTASLATYGGTLAADLGMITGGDSPATRLDKITQAKELNIKQSAKLGAAATKASHEELQALTLRMEGHDLEAMRLEEEIRLRKRLEQIKQLGFDPKTQKAMSDDARAGAHLGSDKLKAAQDRAKAEFAIQQEISDAKDAALGKDSEAVTQAENKLKIMQLQQSLMQQQGITAEAALELATGLVNAETARTAAIKARGQAEAAAQNAAQAAVTNAQAHGHKLKAQKLETENAIDQRAKQIERDTGATPEDARKQATAMQRDLDKVAGKRTVIHGAKSSETFTGLGGADFSGLDAMSRTKNIRLNEQFKFPQLEAKRAADLSAKNKENAAKQARAERQISIAEAPQMIALLTSIDGKVNIA